VTCWSVVPPTRNGVAKPPADGHQRNRLESVPSASAAAATVNRDQQPEGGLRPKERVEVQPA